MTTTNEKEFTLPHVTLIKVGYDAEPSAFTVRALRQQVNANASAVPTSLGGGNHGHLGAVMTAAQYTAATGGAAAAVAAYNAPNRPANPQFHGTAAVVAGQQATYTREKETYLTHTALTRQIKSQLITAINPVYIAALAHEQTGYANVMIPQILDHLETNYGTINQDDLTQNALELEAEWDPETPIETVFTKVLQCQRFATAGGDPISDLTVLRNTLDVFERSGALEDAITDWRKKAVADRTWTNFQTHFKQANRECKRKATSKEAGYAAANAASATTNTAPVQAAAAPTNDSKMHYCWTHGYGFNASHTSASCTNKAAGHIDTATVDNMQGGNNKIRRRRGEQAVYRPPNANQN